MKKLIEVGRIAHKIDNNYVIILKEEDE